MKNRRSSRISTRNGIDSRKYERYDILYLDEFGYDPFDSNVS
jgi:hypothetical protein